jgi:hypothetical protein
MLETVSQPSSPILQEIPIRATVPEHGERVTPLKLQKWSATVTTTRVYGNWGYSFRSKLHVPNSIANFPKQDFTIYRSGNSFIIRNHPVSYWPNIEIKLVAADEHSPLQVARFDVRPTGSRTDSEILYTQIVFSIVSAGNFSLSLDHDTAINFELSKFDPTEERNFLYRAQLFRKLKFIEKVFNCVFHLPENISETDVRYIETVFRGITEGEFTLREDNITFRNYTPTTPDELNRPPFTGIGSFVRNVGDQIPILNLPLMVGPMSIRLDYAVVTNSRAAESLLVGETLPQIRFAVLDNQLHYHFEKYASRRPQIRRQKLERFKKELLKVEPPELVNLLDRPLQSDVSAHEARKVVNGWLQYNDFPDRYCSQEPEIDEGRWRVPIWVTYPRGQGAWVQDAFVDLKTGVVTLPVSVEELHKLGKVAAAECLRAG